MAVPTVQSASSNTAASGTSITINAPSGITADDYLVCMIYCSSATVGSVVQPFGWLVKAAFGSIGGGVYYRRCRGATDPASYTWTWTTNSLASGIIVRVSGVESMEAAVAQINASSTNITAPTATALYSATTLLSIYTTQTANAITVPGGQSNIGGTTGNTRAIIAGYETLSATGGTGTRVATCGVAAANLGCNLILRENLGGILLPMFSGTPLSLPQKEPDAAQTALISGPVTAKLIVDFGFPVRKFGASSNLTGYTRDSSGDGISMTVVLYRQHGSSSKEMRGLEVVTSSSVNGSFSFSDYQPDSTYIVLAYDPNGIYEPIIAFDVTIPDTIVLQQATGNTRVQNKVLKFTTGGRVTETEISSYVGFTDTIGDGSNTSYVVTHNIGSRDVLVQTRRNSSPYDIVECSVEHTSINSCTLTFATAPSTNDIKVIVLG